MDDVIRQSLYEGRAGREMPLTVEGIAEDSPLRTRLWENPCWFSYRLNYLALSFNNPVYGFIQGKLGLLRPDFVVLWSLYVAGPSTLTDLVRASGFPKNTLSRAANKVFGLGMIDREGDAMDQRRVTLHLTDRGRAGVEAVKAEMLGHERLMLDCLSPAERLNLSEILTKLVAASGTWPQSLGGEAAGDDT
ncbi:MULTISPECIES: MarR family winged helix-turn-helix transcriptional regulator [Paracoccus]|jgi:DNA-binding MarR family transcriptional regulator|uniref:Winged helix DNA-binding protein n=1 Tax=Paracoccus litorisediminis TaxID=2006130 RepID=A0A844HLT0_9RHOB|nr:MULTISPECIES: MarR family transcriptional regulator [Paracoccus]MBD9527080.1 winged helix DNA-binding protein [Paracoccus sp. PAR01]MTH59327.1 winged helix DNA-binding protein [Paracoccus litorisediminis]